MRLKQYLNEEYNLDDIDEIITILKKDCKLYINDVQRYYHNNFLFSGRKSNAFFAKKKVRKNRKPKDTPIEIHDLMDDWFYKKFGIRFRSNSFFGSFEESTVTLYGKPFIIFPIGKYSAISSPVVNDVYSEIEEETYDTLGKYIDLESEWKGLSDTDKEKILITVEEILNKADYKDIRKRYVRLPEVMIHCKEYYILRRWGINKAIGVNGLLTKLTT